MPVQWPKKKREVMDGQVNMAKPDSTNFLKLFEDALSYSDERNAQMSGLGKFWIDRMYIDKDGKKQRGEGYIEILLNQPVYNPFGVVFINQDEFKAQPKRKWVRRVAGDPKKRKVKPSPLKIIQDKIR